MSTALADLVGRLKTSGKITADDVLALRKEVYGAPKIEPDAADALIALDLACAERAPEWGEFFAEAMVDYVVRQQDPEDYVDESKCNWLTSMFDADLNSDSAVEALVRITETATGAPPSLSAFALKKLTAFAVAAGTIGAAEIDLLRRLVFAGGGAGDIGVTRDEADMLFDINDACGAGAGDDWADFFAKAVADALTAVSPFKLESRDEALKDEAWLGERESPFDFAKQMLHVPDVRGAVHDMLDPFADEGNEWRAPDAAMDAAETAAAPISDEEAKWLIGRLGDGALSEPERRLITLLRQIAPQSSGLLQPLLGASAAPGEAPADPPVFGRRATNAA